MKRLLLLFVGLAILLLIPFLIWGDLFESWFTRRGTVEWLRTYGTWAWLPALLLLVGDLVLPVPGTVVMSAIGFVYGPLVGGLISALGAVLAGMVGYGLCRSLGRSAALVLLDEDELADGEQLFRNSGGWIVAISRWLPLLSETIACMAGLTRMPFLKFTIALVCGSIPLGFTFAVIGYAGVEYPLLAILLSAGLPPVFWYLARRFINPTSDGGDPPSRAV